MPEHAATDLRPLLARLASEIETVYDNVRELPVAPDVTVDELRARVARTFDLTAPLDAAEVVERATSLLREFSLHVTHPRYFGLFNPSVLPATIVADALVALFNPQTGGWSHAPAANEIERLTLRHLAKALGFGDDVSAHYTSGGNEANHTAVVTALAHTFPAWRERGLRALDAAPAIYLSSESHHSFAKVARATGLGTDALRAVEADGALELRGDAVAAAIERDLARGARPFMLVATTGTTGAGTIDPVPELAEVARRYGLWLHVDAAWGGAACLVPQLKHHLDGVALADSLTWDAHKWLSVPLGAGMFFCRHDDALAKAFGVETGYVPPTEPGGVDLYKHSMQWSRRHIGLKVLFALAEQGSEGIARIVGEQARIGDRLREKLTAAGWTIENETPLPLVCFSHPSLGRDAESTKAFLAPLLARRRVWISDVALPGRGWVLRACITSFRTTERDLDVLIEELEGKAL
jgi:glutamate/tyrosine decarboxylase-like PLP-dependent enzyme